MNYSVPVSARMPLRELKTIFLRCPMRQSGSLIGSIAWLHQNQARLSRTKHGLVLVDLGDGGSFTYKKAGDVMPKLVGRRSTS
jgi:aminopeptidase-like protein